MPEGGGEGPGAGDALLPGAAIDGYGFVEVRVVFEKFVCGGLDGPGDVGVKEDAPEGGESGKGGYDVAEGGESNDENPTRGEVQFYAPSGRSFWRSFS